MAPHSNAGEVIAGIADPLVVQDAGWRFTLINPAAARILESSGRGPADALIGRVVWDVYPEVVGTDFERGMRLAMRDRVPVTFEAFYPERGEWSQMHCYPLQDGSLVTQWRDVTARRQAEEAARYLARASEILASSLDSQATFNELAHLVVPELADWCVIDTRTQHGGLTRVAVAHRNPEMVAYARELEARYPTDIDAPTGVPNVLRTGKPEMYVDISPELLARGARDAEHLRILRELDLRSVIIVPLAAGAETHGAMTLISTTSRRRYTQADLQLATELGRRAGLALDNARLLADARAATARTARLQDVTARLAAIVDPRHASQEVLAEAAAAFGAHSGVLCLLDHSGEWLDIAAALGLKSTTTSEYQRFPVAAPLPVSEAVTAGVGIFLEGKAEIQARYPQLRDENKRATTEAWLAVPLAIAGRVIGGLALGFLQPRRFSAEERDFAGALAQQAAQALDRIKVYEAEQHARRDAEIANRAKADFLAAMSHELRTPLNAIGGYAELLEMGIHGEITPAQREALSRIRRSERHLRDVIENVLGFARIEAGHLELRPARVGVRAIIRDVESMLSTRMAQKRLRFSFTNCDEALAAWADAEKVRQILINLVGNAVKFTPEAGSIEVSGNEEGGNIEVQVIDSGIGIPPDKLEVIFEPFVQLGRSLSSVQEGSGLGLAISRDLARAMSGDLTASSQPGKGSTFTLRLPAAAP
jgi:signal transduction histidine kinase